MAQPEYTVILRDGIRYDVDLRDASKIEAYSSNHYNNKIIDIWVDHRQIFINLNMVIAVERREAKNYDKRTKWQRFLANFKMK